ncbi:MAG: peptidoglycan DD-metalloendopeptidase family protein [Bacillota bacterium]
MIARTYETDIATLLSLNPDLSSTVIQPGQVLDVAPDFRGLRHVVQRGETLSAIASAYDLPVSDIEAENHLAPGGQIPVGQPLLLPGARERKDRGILASRNASARRAAQPATDRAAFSAGWTWPITGGLHSSEFGQRWGGFHSGLDIAVPTGTPAAAVAAGTVQFAGWDGGYGFSVILDHGDGLMTRYAHASKLLVVEGQEVEQGENVILVGATGNSTGPHLHFEVLLGGTPQNPRVYLP